MVQQISGDSGPDCQLDIGFLEYGTGEEGTAG